MTPEHPTPPDRRGARPARDPDAGHHAPKSHGSASNPIAWVEDFVGDHYMRQPVWVRTFVYLVAFLLLIWGTLKLIDGNFIVSGRVMEKIGENRLRAVRGKDVRLGTVYYGTNAQGWYSAVLNPIEFAGLVAGNKLRMEVLEEEVTLATADVGLVGLGRKTFDDITIEPEGQPGGDDTPFGPIGMTTGEDAATARHPEADLTAPPAFSLGGWWVSDAWAQSPAGGERLAVRSLRLQPDAKGVRLVTLMLNQGGMLTGLTGAENRPIAELSTVAGSTVSFGDEYVYPLGGTWAGGTLEMRDSRPPILQNAFRSGYSESFSVPATLQPGFTLLVNGGRGSVVEVRRFLPYDLILFRKADIEPLMTSLRYSYERSGVRVIESSSPIGYRGQTNSLYGGQGVPFPVIQQVARLAWERGVRFKQIRYRLPLRSKQANQIQLGGYTLLDPLPWISAAKFDAIVRARTEVEFQRAIALANPFVPMPTPIAGAGN